MIKKDYSELPHIHNEEEIWKFVTTTTHNDQIDAMLYAYHDMYDMHAVMNVFKYINEDKQISKDDKILTICGSMKFSNIMLELEQRLTLKGYTVLMPMMLEKDDYTEDSINTFRAAHLEKIMLSDAIYVVNVDGYVGQHTASEIEFAVNNGKKVYFLEHDDRQKYVDKFYERREVK